MAAVVASATPPTPATAPVAATTATDAKEDKDLTYIKSLITAHENFPKKGVLFRDIFPVFLDAVATEMLFARLQYHIQTTYGKVDYIVGLDSRGFLIGPTLATRLKAGFVPIRKAGKLPGECYKVEFTKEYGGDSFEIQKASIKPRGTVIVVDDLLATGGTLVGALELLKKVDANVLECLLVMELSDLNGRARVPAPVHALIAY